MDEDEDEDTDRAEDAVPRDGDGDGENDGAAGNKAEEAFTAYVETMRGAGGSATRLGLGVYVGKHNKQPAGREWMARIKAPGSQCKYIGRFPSEIEAIKAALGAKGKAQDLKAGEGEGAGWLPFNKALSLVRSLKLPNELAWKVWSKSSARPANIPADPLHIYQRDGWQGYDHWLGSTSPQVKTPTRSVQSVQTTATAMGKILVTARQTIDKRAPEKECSSCFATGPRVTFLASPSQISNLKPNIGTLFFKMAQRLDSRCVLLPTPKVPGVQNMSRIQHKEVTTTFYLLYD